MLLPPLTNFEIPRFHQNKPRFNVAYSRNNLLKIKDGVQVINLDGCESIGAYLIDLYVNRDTLRYFDGFRVEHIPKEINQFTDNKNITTNILRK